MIQEQELISLNTEENTSCKIELVFELYGKYDHFNS